MKKNNLDNLFKDRLKDFQQSPPDGMWERISGTLDRKKKKKRLVALWWQLGGAAAILAFLLFLGVIPTGKETNVILTDTTEQPLEQDGRETTPITPLKQDPEGAVAGTAEETLPSSIPSSPKQTDNSKGDFDTMQKEKAPGENIRNADLAGANNKTQGEHGELKTTDYPAESITRSSEGNSDTRQQNTTQLAADEKDKDTEKNLIDQSVQSSEVAVNTSKEPDVEQEEKRSIFEVVDAEEELAQQESNPKWSVGPRIAPVYFNSFGQGSPIHSSFTANSKSGNVNMSYGITVSYDLSPKLRLRSGLHKVDYGYDTNDVSFSASPIAGEQAKLDHIDYNITSRNLVVRSEASPKSEPTNGFADVSAQSPGKSGRMNQQFGYLEVPLELNYVLSDRKLGVDLIGGISTLFLTDNSLVLEAEGNQTLVGDANNINSLNFSTNIGLGFYYRIAPSIQLNIDPVFKYQLNTFSDIAGSFNPYSLGVYSGLNIRF
ncbi:outer membrane beta-barrel protein [Zeaxanthinibacter enoshimensis]|uniref:outer membrane beta-barrel protein n=1 Tax=Zeaxanthinibacter enoshimensis TaxID=392009 RepID=UPI003566F131